MPEPDSSVQVVDNPERSRYEAYVGDELAGLVTYRTRPGVQVLVHTEVEGPFEGHGLGSRLASAVLDQVRARGLHVVPVCPFIAGYIDRHPELSDLVAKPGS
ncbi:MAG TPA: GNAT family N-acetyltransferase [Acidimicrobiales bacterium]|nr:GNAT family N-acetyltransferase [Acidimicrobiales bacterium]